ncbi:alpha/beta hydrolase [Fodinicola feengrottensis]|uniref:Alpha/beta hydrolase n=1 Tax=Fodinicola feengrottensis TaxID=435914 RepID=A0ABN2HX64_9ACTN
MTIVDGLETVTSPDGTSIGYRTYGSGPGVVLVPGALHSGHHYQELACCLADEFTIYAMDRRGRPGSGRQLPHHSIDDECADVMAVMEKTGASRLFGHSSGGVVALQTALRVQVTKVAVYEPAVMGPASVPPVKDLAAMERALAEGRQTDAFAMLAKGESGPVPKMPLFALKMLFRLASKGTNARFREYVDAVAAFPAEQRMIMGLGAEADRYRELATETLVLLGARTGGELARGARFLAATAPGARLQVLAGLNHDAPDEKAPGRVAAELRPYFSRSSL